MLASLGAMSMTARLRSVPETDLAELRKLPDLPAEFWDFPDLDLDQSWDALTRVLSADDRGGSGWAGRSILGGTPFGEDQGFGPCRTFNAEEVAAIAEALGSISLERFRELYALADWTDCYSAPNYDVDEAWRQFQRLRGCYQTAAAAGRAMTLFM
jgi:hypothetical protein